MQLRISYYCNNFTVRLIIRGGILMKKLFTLLLSLAMLVSLAVPAFATELEGAYTQEEINAINEVNIAKYAKSFVDAVSDDPDLESGDVLTIYSENDKISGYCIDIVKDSLPNGYVVVKFSNNEPVVSEFSLGAGVQNPYEVIMELSLIHISEPTRP